MSKFISTLSPDVRSNVVKEVIEIIKLKNFRTTGLDLSISAADIDSYLDGSLGEADEENTEKVIKQVIKSIMPR